MRSETSCRTARKRTSPYTPRRPDPGLLPVRPLGSGRRTPRMSWVPCRGPGREVGFTGMRAVALHQPDVSVMWRGVASLFFSSFQRHRSGAALPGRQQRLSGQRPLVPERPLPRRLRRQRPPPAPALPAPAGWGSHPSRVPFAFQTPLPRGRREELSAHRFSPGFSAPLGFLRWGTQEQIVSAFEGFRVLLALLVSGLKWVSNCQLCTVPHWSSLNKTLIWPS